MKLLIDINELRKNTNANHINLLFRCTMSCMYIINDRLTQRVFLVGDSFEITLGRSYDEYSLKLQVDDKNVYLNNVKIKIPGFSYISDRHELSS